MKPTFQGEFAVTSLAPRPRAAQSECEVDLGVSFCLCPCLQGSWGRGEKGYRPVLERKQNL